MKIYAVSWVMASYVDSHLKKLFAENPELKISGFIFPVAKVSDLAGIPVYDASTAPIDPEAVYVDFSFRQELDPAAQLWSHEAGLKIYSIRDFLDLLYSFSNSSRHSLLLEGIPLRLIRDVRVSSEQLKIVSIPSIYHLIKVLNAYRDLNFRSLHRISEVQTLEGYALKIIQDFNQNIRGGVIAVYVMGFDNVAAQLSKIHFSLREMKQLTIKTEGKDIYQLAGRDKNFGNVSVHFLSSARIFDVEEDLEDESFLLIRLDDGLLNIESTLRWIQNLKYSVKKIEFAQISSRLSDAFISCQLVRDPSSFL